ncbi:MAG: helix-turn-helix transcriptional regulator [Dehalococcoidia bacterium]
MAPVLVANADRMMTSAEVLEPGIRLTFADGRTGTIPFKDLPDIGDASRIASVEIPDPYEVIIRLADGRVTEIPWDFARHYCDPGYEPRIRAVAARGRQSIGARIRELRQSSGLTQDQLATKARIGRVTLVRIEKGEQSPRYETLESIAFALGRSMGELLVPDASVSSG